MKHLKLQKLQAPSEWLTLNFASYLVHGVFSLLTRKALSRSQKKVLIFEHLPHFDLSAMRFFCVWTLLRV